MPTASRASSWRLPLLNCVLPGAGLLITGRLNAGLLLLVPTVILIALILGVLAIFTRAAAWPLIGGFVSAYAALALIASGWWWWLRRRATFDPVAVRALHRLAAIAYLQGRSNEAVTLARRLVAAAPEESGTWNFLALVASDAGDARTAARAEARATAIDLR